MRPNTVFLRPEERQVVNLLIQAVDQMSAIYDRQTAGKGTGHGFYPADLTKAELDAYVAAHPSERVALLDGCTIVRREGDGDYAGMVAFFDRYAHLDDNARSVIATLGDIHVDISPVYPDKI